MPLPAKASGELSFGSLLECGVGNDAGPAVFVTDDPALVDAMSTEVFHRRTARYLRSACRVVLAYSIIGFGRSRMESWGRLQPMDQYTTGRQREFHLHFA